ncbi:MAG: hypothetical protein Q8P41_17705, partial [Pseudomonadota bacterium]|nr:hypothetical protein [Pseudomonadota bacterium]
APVAPAPAMAAAPAPRPPPASPAVNGTAAAAPNANTASADGGAAAATASAAARPLPSSPGAASAPSVAITTGASVRTPDTLKNGLRGEPQPYKLARSADTPPMRRRLPVGSSLADVVGHLVGQVVPLRVALDGRLLGWYRLGPASGPLPADTRLETLDPEQTLVFHFVESRIVTCDIEIHAADRVTRLRAPVATATPVASLVDALAVLVDLPAGDWSAALDGVALEPFHILEDRPFGPRSVLAVKRA